MSTADPAGPEEADDVLEATPIPSRGVLRRQGDVLAVIAAGGVVGSLGRWGVSLALSHRTGQVPWSTVTVNVLGCLLIGALMIVVLEVAPPSRYLRPFLGTGVLGGFTTFSTYALDVVALVEAGRPLVAAGYLAGTLLGGLAAVVLGAALARAAVSASAGEDRYVDPPGRPS